MAKKGIIKNKEGLIIGTVMIGETIGIVYKNNNGDIVGSVEELIGVGSSETTPIVLTGKELGEFDTSTAEGKKAMRAELRKHLEGMADKNGVYCAALDSNVIIDQRGINETIAWTGNPVKMQALFALKDLIKTAKDAQREENTKKDKKREVLFYHKLKNKLTVDGKDVAVELIIEEWVDGHYHYDMLIDKTKTAHIITDSAAYVQHRILDTKSKSDWVDGNITSNAITSQAMLDSVGDGMVLNLFLKVKDPVTGQWVDVPDEMEVN
jgi:hypothetical protein